MVFKNLNIGTRKLLKKKFILFKYYPILDDPESTYT